MTNIKEFLLRFGMNIIDSNNRISRYRYPSSIYNDPYMIDYNKMDFETEVLHTIQISESSLKKLFEFYERVDESVSSTGSLDIFFYHLNRQEKEEALRKKYPAVQKAYDQYKMLLKLSQSGE